MKTTPRAALRRLKTGVAAGAVATSGLLLTAPAHAADKVVPSNLVDQSETRSTGHNVFGTDGVRVYTEGSTSTDKAAGYFDAHVALADAGEPSMSWSANAGQTSNVKPSVQLKVDFDDDGSIDGILVGEPTYADGSPLYGNDWWLSNGSAQFVKDGAPSHEGGSGSANHGTLDQWRTAFADADIVQAGWSLGSGVKGDGTINSITVGDDEYFFAKADDATEKVLYDADVDESDTRAAGHNEFRPTTGIHVYTDDSSSLAKADGYFAVSESLATAGEPSMEYRTISGTIPPGLQLVIDFDGNGTPDGKLVGEPQFYGADWWLSNSSAQFVKDGAPRHTGGSGSDNHGLLSEWRAEFPDAQILEAGYSLGSGVKGDYIIDAITVGLTRHTFSGQNVAPTAGIVTGSVQAGKQVTVTLKGADRNEDDLTYTVTDDGAGTATVDGNDLTFTAANNFHGVTTLTYQVSDGNGGTAAGQVRINIGKASSTTAFVLKPTAPTSATTPAVDITVSSTGYMKGGRVDVYVNQKLVNSGTTYSTGKALLSLKRKLTKGTHSVSVYYRGTSYTLPSFKGMKVTITR